MLYTGHPQSVLYSSFSGQVTKGLVSNVQGVANIAGSLAWRLAHRHRPATGRAHASAAKKKLYCVSPILRKKSRSLKCSEINFEHTNTRTHEHTRQCWNKNSRCIRHCLVYVETNIPLLYHPSGKLAFHKLAPPFVPELLRKLAPSVVPTAPLCPSWLNVILSFCLPGKLATTTVVTELAAKAFPKTKGTHPGGGDPAQQAPGSHLVAFSPTSEPPSPPTALLPEGKFDQWTMGEGAGDCQPAAFLASESWMPPRGSSCWLQPTVRGRGKGEGGGMRHCSILWQTQRGGPFSALPTGQVSD